MKRISLARKLAVALPILILLLCTSARAQNLGSVHGRVTDASGAAVPSVTVEIVGHATGVTRSAIADDSGSYQIADVNPETYTLTVAQTGFQKFVNSNVRVEVSTSTQVDIPLQVGDLAQTVTVESTSAPLLNTADATTGNTFDERQVEDLPFLARNVVNLLSLQPGVVFTGASDTDTLALGSVATMDNREGVVNGVRGNESNITVDGVDSNNWFNQGAFSSALPLTLDAVQEVRLTTGNANATDGTASGGQVALVTKSGSNDFHGNARWYYRTSGFTANQFFDNAAGIDRPKLLRNIGGGSLGGRIVKNRVFFFLDNEERRDSSDVTEGPEIIPTQSLKDGVLIYACADPTKCPGGMVQGLTGPHAVPAGAFGLTPANIAAIDPAHLGINQSMLTYMKLFPTGNDPSAGLDGGLSYTGFRFNAPFEYSSNIYIARLDFNLTADGRHSIFWRGSLIGAADTLTPEQFPGQGAAQNLLNNSRGTSVQYQAQISPVMTNTVRYGFTRLGVSLSGIATPSFGVRDYTTNVSFAAPSHVIAPVNEFNDTLSWTRGRHTMAFGGTIRFLQIQRENTTGTFPMYSANPGQCSNLCTDAYSNVSSILNDPTPVDTTHFTENFMMLTGPITGVQATLYSDPHTQTFLTPGTPEHRTTAERGYEVFGQDSWRLRSNLTITAGLHWSYETPPWEVNGFEVAPTIDLDQWFFQRVANMNKGLASNLSPLVSWNVAGNDYGKDSWYRPYYKNFAPRFAIAYSPAYQDGFLAKLFGGPGKSSIRAGFGMYYDRVGQPIALDSDNFGSPGVSTSVSDALDPFTLATTPRFSGTCSNAGCTGLPSVATLAPVPASAKLPFTPAANFGTFAFFVDPHLRTPYTQDVSLSYQRELPGRMSVEVAYIGTFGRRLLAKADYGQYLNIKDPKSGQTLWQAEDMLAEIAGPNPNAPNIDPTNIAALKTIPSIAFYTDMMSNFPSSYAIAAKNPAYASLTPAQAYYSYQLSTFAGTTNWACGIAIADRFPQLGIAPSPWSPSVDPKGQGFVVLAPQFHSLGGWTNWGFSAYNSLQVSVHKNVGHAIFTGSYVYSHSIDNDSSPENGDVGGNYGTLVGLIQNPFDLRQNRASSDFDLRHNVNGNFVVRLPFGQGERYGANVDRALNAVIGGWSVSGLARWRSGFPLTIGEGFSFPTSWQHGALGTLIHPVSTSLTRSGPGGVPNLFNDPASVLANDFRFTLPGFGGTRNSLIGPGYFSTDAGIFKTFVMPWAAERQRLQVRITAFNVFNNVNFSPGAPWYPGNVSGSNGLSLDPTSPATFGQITQTAGPRGGAREMEMALRYEF
jgi:hypothetical protein